MAAAVINYFLCFVMIFLCRPGSADDDKKLYVVYMGSTASTSKGDGFSLEAASSEYLGMLKSVHGSSDEVKKSLRVIYGKSFRGFAAMLSPSHAQQLSDMHGVVSVFESKKLQLMTTRSWDFIGLPASAQTNNLDYQSNIIIGLLDSGIWPESNSFKDEGLGPVPSKWKGSCTKTSDFNTCNRKLIGAKYYRSSTDPLPPGEYPSPRDGNGHGTHTSSTAAGNLIKNASLYGLSLGESRGGVPGARVAMYKTCWGPHCHDADILAAFDDAIYDGVDIISVSLGIYIARHYFEDSIAIGAFHATKRGILVSNSAGNDGPYTESVANYSPWSLTLAASTIDHNPNTQILLGNNISIMGIAINTYTMEQPWYPLVYGGDVANVSGGFTSVNSSYCVENSLDQEKVKGKIVLCNVTSYPPDYTVFKAGGAGTIIILDESDNDGASPFINPASAISSKQAHTILSYIRSTSSPVARIQKTANAKEVAPIVASFSSRGYNPITQDILKPDITAPGVNILASWAKTSRITDYPEDTRFPNFNIISGTSMSAPHAAGAAGFVKSYHPDWSPAAIKSALMTTAFELNPSLPGNEDAEFAYGAGQINPIKAVDPGLVYDIDINDYINILCKDEAYNDTTLRMVTGDFSSCNGIEKVKNGARKLNYPSIMVFVTARRNFEAVFPRTVTNVGVAESEYKAIVSAPGYQVNVTVEPDTLSFSSLNQKLSFNVTVQGGISPDTVHSATLTWKCGKYSVRSPISVFAP